MEKPTIREVAKLAGVAVGTVSNVLNGSARVRDSTRRKVETAMRQLGFRPDAIARTLIRRRGNGPSIRPVPGRPRLSTVGYVSVDYTARIDAFPISGERITSQGIMKSLGGPAANVAVMAAGLGGRCAINCELITALGTDPDSEWALAELADRGVRTITIHPHRDDRLSRCIVLVDNNGARTIINEPIRLGLDELSRYLGRPESGDERHCLHVEGYQAPTVTGLLSNDRCPGLLTSVQATGLPEAWRTVGGFCRLLDIFDVVFLNRECACQILDCPDDLAIICTGIGSLFRQLAPSRRTRLLVVTLGADGAFVDDLHGKSTHMAAASVPVIDRTGVGDAFVGCFLASWLNGDDPVAAARLATAAGGLAVSFEGAQGPRISMEMLANQDSETDAGFMPSRNDAFELQRAQ